MILTEKQKNFLKKNRESLFDFYKGRIEELKEEIINDDDVNRREGKRLLIQEYRIMMKDISDLFQVERPPDNLI